MSGLRLLSNEGFLGLSGAAKLKLYSRGVGKCVDSRTSSLSRRQCQVSLHSAHSNRMISSSWNMQFCSSWERQSFLRTVLCVWRQYGTGVTYIPPGRSSKLPFKSRWLKEDLNYLSLLLLIFIIVIDKRSFSHSRPRSAAIHWAIYTESLLTNNAVGKFS
jgi:hypothetical protein